jgi:hypothetical protein
MNIQKTTANLREAIVNLRQTNVKRWMVIILNLRKTIATVRETVVNLQKIIVSSRAAFELKRRVVFVKRRRVAFRRGYPLIIMIQSR